MSEEKKLNGTVIVTYRCNARCSMCNRYKAPSKPEEEISIVFGKVVLVSSLAVDWPFGVGLRLYESKMPVISE